MANTTFNGPVRSEKGFQQVNKNTSTGAYTARTLGLKPDLTSLTATAVSTSSTLTYAADTITINNFTGAAAQAVTLPAATVGTVVAHLQSDDTAGGTATLSFTCAGSDVMKTGSKIETTTGNIIGMDTSIANETVLTFTPEDAATNRLTFGCYLYFTCYTKGTWDFAFSLSTDAVSNSGTFVWS
mgnify:FL=1|jgi:hypothetical protein|tara:strand:+ start:188 stop:739 length:552 start_codon:yes stop_codon:yes gene_type:complete